MESLRAGSALTTQLKTRLAALVAIIVIVGAVAWYLIDRGSSTSTSIGTVTSSNLTTTASVSATQLAQAGKALGQPIYWLGPLGISMKNELTTSGTGGEVFMRYLPAAAALGSSTPYLSIGTYPMKNAFAVTTARAAESGSVRVAAPGSAVAFYLTGRPQNIYLAYPGSAYQVEVFDPSAAVTREIVASGFLTNAAGTAETTTRAVTAAQLADYSSALGQPIFWLGARAGMTNEFTRTSTGRIYVSYLPKGAALGTRTAYLTVGTYPVNDAYAVTRQLTGSSNTLTTTAKTVALSLKTKPLSEYVAYQGTNYQVEVYDPVASVARGLVAAGLVTKAG